MEKYYIEKKLIGLIISKISEGVIITNMDRKIVEFSEGATHITGYTKLETFDKPIEEIIKLAKDSTPVPVDEFCPIESFEIDGAIFSETSLKLTTRAGETKIVNVTTNKIKEGAEVDIGCVLTITDKSKETELEHMKLDFVSMSAHVLRTPVTIIRGYAQTLLKENTIAKLEAVEIDSINQIATAANDLRDRIENMLALSNIKEGEIRVNPIPLSLEATVKTVMEAFRPRATEKNLELKYIPQQDEIPRAYAEVGKIKDVLEKLLDNAIKFTEQGSIEIWIQPEGEFLKTVVKDTGPGIADEGITQLFTKFYRVKRKALEMESGSGLSLYTSKRIVEAMGGTIGVESKQSAGSKFFFTVPAYKYDLEKKTHVI